MANPTILSILEKTTQFFKDKGIGDARLDAQWIMSHCLNLSRMDLYIHFDKPLGDAELENCREMVRRRGKREPLQYILGYAHFRDLKVPVDKRVLIPRPETEQLVDLCIEASTDLQKQNTPATALEIGVGSAAVLCSLIKEISGWFIEGSEISTESYQAACENFAHFFPDTKCPIYHGSLFSPFESSKKWSLILSNPPYIGENEKPLLQAEVRDFEPTTALYGGKEGHELPCQLIAEAYTKLNPGGILILEMGATQSATLKAKAKEVGYQNISVIKDLQDKERFLRCMVA